MERCHEPLDLSVAVGLPQHSYHVSYVSSYRLYFDAKFVYREWEQFIAHPMPGGKVALKSHHGKWLCAESNGNAVCNRGAAQAWEMHTLEVNGNGKVGLKSCHGKYLSAQSNHTLQWNRYLYPHSISL